MKILKNIANIVRYKPIAISAPAIEELNLIEEIAEQWLNEENNTLKIWTQADGWEIIEHNDTGISISRDPNYPEAETYDYIDGLEYIQNEETAIDERILYLFIDIQRYINTGEQHQDPILIRKIKSTTNAIRQSYKKLGLIGESIKLPNELEGCFEEIKYELPNLEKIEETIDECLEDLKEITEISISPTGKENLKRVCQGLTIGEIRDAIYLTYLESQEKGGLTDQLTLAVNDRKIKKLNKLNVKFSNPPDVEVGGLENLKQWLKNRTPLFNAQIAQTESNLPNPKGVLLVGIPGTGKSLIAKTIGSIWNIPILSVNFGDLYDSLVGQTEQNVQRLLSIAEAIAPCVLFMDEIEKALAGASSGGDSGVSERVFGTFLNWMQEKTAPVFVVATANKINTLPPELTRKGRFDEIFFVDLPTEEERVAILENHLQTNAVQTKFKATEIKQIAEKTENYSGAELASLVQEALLDSFSNGTYGEITIAQLLQQTETLVPLAHRYKENISQLRQWAEYSARKANGKPQKASTQPQRTKQSKTKIQNL